MENFKTYLEFQKLLKKFNSIYRDCGALHNPNIEDNDVEHSYRVAMLCWMIIEEYQLDYDLNKVIKYALVHDFVEIYAGDKSIYLNYNQEDKEKDEMKSLLRLEKEFPKLKSIWEIIHNYEKREDDESKFIYIIEKLEPIFLVILSEEDHFIKRKVKFEDFIDRKQKKIKDIDNFAQIFNKETMEYLELNKDLFYK